MKVKLLSENAILPKKGSQFAAGYDLYSAENVIISKNGVATIKTDISLQIPNNCYGRIAPRSGLASKNYIGIGGGVIDPDYRGNIGVIMFNHSNEDFQVLQGDRIAQLIIEQIITPELEIIDEFDDNTERNDKGFGSTGVSIESEKSIKNLHKRV
jgi:dUTP pyrophosphatase